MKYRIISADSHNQPAPHMFERYMPPSLRDRAPKLVDLDNGGQGWEIEDVEAPTALGTTAVNYRAEKRYDRADYRKKFMEVRDGYSKQKGVRYDMILPGAFDPDARLKEQDEDQVDAEVIYADPPFWSGVKAIRDTKLRLACSQTYNDWAAEFDSRDPARLITPGLLPNTGIDDCIAEMKRCTTDLKLSSVTLESYPNGSLVDPAPEDDRFWSTAEEMGIIVNIHANFSFPPLNNKLFAEGKLGTFNLDAGSFQTILNKLILDGVFERHPDLTLVGAEVNCGWIPFYFEQFDDRFRRYHRQLGTKLALLPSEYFKRNVKITYILDQVGVDSRYPVGVENMMWSSDYPHSVSNFPLDAQLANEQLTQANATAGERERILWKNCADLYGLPYEE